jgi:hypothetical protein
LTGETSLAATRAPREAKASASARPAPFPAPVIKTTLSFKLDIGESEPLKGKDIDAMEDNCWRAKLTGHEWPILPSQVALQATSGN